MLKFPNYFEKVIYFFPSIALYQYQGNDMERINYLLYRYTTGRCSAEEKAELTRWAKGNEARMALLQRLADPQYISRQYMRRSLVPYERPLSDMRRRIIRFRLRSWRTATSIAAMLAIVAGMAATYIIYSGNEAAEQTDSEATIAEATHQATRIRLDEIHPGTTRARLTSTASGGRAIELRAGDTVSMASAPLLSRNGSPASDSPAELCLDVPRGGEFKVVLEDSTIVWLNSESTLRYPEVFSGNERRVSITGEAYFEVSHDSSRPFYVDTPEQTVKVYGTAFNVRAYTDDPYIYTTLEEGSISISRRDIHSGEVMLSPGHQALLDRAKPELGMRVVDPKAISGWRHGRFVFEEQPLASIMRDLSRWYDIEYEFADPELEHIVFMGSIPRYTDFATAISIIEKSGGIRFTTRDGKVLISRS